MNQDSSNISVEVIRKCPNMLKLKCTLKDWTNSTKVFYKAPQPPDLRQSYTGSAIPFPDAEIAFDNTINQGTIITKKSVFYIRMKYPNAYYSHLGTKLIPPHVILTVQNSKSKYTKYVVLDEVAPFRLLSYPSNPAPRTNPVFYDRSQLDNNRTQEAILRESGYRLVTPDNFWGNAVPHT